MYNQDTVIQNIINEQDPIKKGHLIEEAIKHKVFSVKELAHRISMKPAYVCHYMRLSRLPELVLDGFYGKLISLSHLFVISRLIFKKDMIDVYEATLSGNLTVQKTEHLVREKLYGVKTVGEYLTAYEKEELLSPLKKKFRNATFTITQSRTKTKLNIEFKGSLTTTSALTRQILKELSET